MAIETRHREAVRKETIVSIGINSLIPAAVIWLLDVTPPETLLGPGGIIGSLLPAAGLATFLMTLILTPIVRLRVRKGGLPALDWPRRDRGYMRWLPNHLLLRAAVLGLLAVALLVPSGLALVALLGILPFGRVEFLLFNLAYGACVGLVMARFVVLPALADRPRAAVMLRG